MNPQYVRLIFPSNQNIQLVAPLQQSISPQAQPCAPAQVRLINPNSTFVIRPVIRSTFDGNASSQSPIASLNTDQQILQQKPSSMTTISSSPEPSENNLMQLSSISATDSQLVKSVPLSPFGTSVKRNYSSSDRINKICVKSSSTKDEDQENCQKKVKRGKNWLEEETNTFISIWSDYYGKLMSAGSRNTCVYQSMAQQLNELLSPRIMTGGDVKAKISNLVAEYRRKKKEQGKTGASPSCWKHFDQIDKLLGERPFNDDSLMTDSISFQQEHLEEIENTSIVDSNVNQILEDIDDNTLQMIKDIEQSEDNFDKRSSTIKSPNNSTTTRKHTTSNTPEETSHKKNIVLKKKKIADVRVDLMQQMISKIDAANETAATADRRTLELLEKQTKLQEDSLNNEKEFLNVFKNIANSFNTSR